MIKLTEKGKQIYGFRKYIVYARGGVDTVDFCCEEVTIAANPTELKALVGLGLITIK
jgi:hypothetical protein